MSTRTSIGATAVAGATRRSRRRRGPAGPFRRACSCVARWPTAKRRGRNKRKWSRNADVRLQRTNRNGAELIRRDANHRGADQADRPFRPMAGQRALDADRTLELLDRRPQDAGGGGGHRVQCRLLGPAHRRPAADHDDAAGDDVGIRPARAQRARARRHQPARTVTSQRAGLSAHQRSDVARSRPPSRSPSAGSGPSAR